MEKISNIASLLSFRCARCVAGIALLTCASLPVLAQEGGSELPIDTGTIRVIVKSGLVRANSFEAVRVMCPEGMVALSGGIDPYNVLTMQVTSSAPVFTADSDPESSTRLISLADGEHPAPIGWQASVRNSEAVPRQVTANVLCAKVSNVRTVVRSDYVRPDSFGNARAMCPEGAVALGGGVDSYNVLTSTVTSSAPVFPVDAPILTFQPDGDAPAPNGWQGSSRSQDGTQGIVKVAAICGTA